MENIYDKIGLDRRMRAKTSMVSRANYTPAIDFSNLYEVSSNKLNASKVNLGEFVKKASGGTALGTFNTSEAFTATSTITYLTPKASNKTFGVPIIAFYQGAGTSAANEIYPSRGTNVTLGRYDVFGGVADYSRYNGTSCTWTATIVDTNGTSSQSFTFAADWLFTDYVTDDIA